MRPCLRSRSGATSGQRASAAPGGGNGCDHDAGAAAADGLNAGRTCAAVRPCLRSRSGATSGQRASAAPDGGNGCDHDAGAAAADGLNAGRTCAAVRPLPAVTLRGNVRAMRQRCP
ncbi:hypothetical protein Q3R63_004395, partial [Salmonella enterica]|nr:hypothetical protein [Salmonella enterica]